MRGWLVSSGLALVAATSTGCKSELCAKMYDRNKECAPADRRDKMGDRDEYIEKCRADRRKAKDEGKDDPEEDRATAACLDVGDCEQMQQCLTAESERRYTERQLAAIAAAEDSGDIAEMKHACQYVSEDNERLVEACRGVMAKLLAHTREAVQTMRDAGEHDFSVCGELEQFAEAVGGDEPARAKSLCTEAQAAQTVAKAVREAAAKVEAKQPDLPYACGAALDELAKIESDWAKAKKAEVVEACFGKLGLVIMEVKVPRMKYVCDFRVKEIYDAVNEYGVDDEAMQAWMAKARPLCATDGSAVAGGGAG